MACGAGSSLRQRSFGKLNIKTSINITAPCVPGGNEQTRHRKNIAKATSRIDVQACTFLIKDCVIGQYLCGSDDGDIGARSRECGAKHSAFRSNGVISG